MAAALTNCDTCAHDYPATVGRGRKARMCKRVDAMFNDHTDEEQALGVWVADNCGDGGPIPNATGCPEHVAKATS